MRRAFTTVVLVLLAFIVWPTVAHAGPSGGSSSASFSTDKGGKSKSSGSGFDWPEMVVGGNAISAQMPLQFGLVGYLPKARFAFQYDRQLRKGHWIHGGAAIVFDYARWKNFRMDNCGLETAVGTCGKGGVVGFDVYAGYTYKFFLRERPWLVPFVRGSLGFQWFALPNLGGGDADRLQTRTRSWTLNIRPGGGIRIFLLSSLGVGADVNIPLGFLIHRDLPLGADVDSQGAFLLGIEVLPLVVEYRF